MRLPVLVGAAALGALGTAGCYTHQCDPTTVPYSRGELSDAGGVLTYSTTPLNSPDEPWVSYAGEETLVVTYPESIARALVGYELRGVSAYVGTSDHPADDDAATFTPISGNPAEFSSFTADNTGFSVTNATCASYSAVFTVTYAPVSASADADPEAAPSPVDASTDSTAPPPDASE